MEVNKELLNLYYSKMPKLKESLNVYNENTNDKATNPLLIKVSEKWANSNVKIMIIGQETYTWCGECGSNGVFSANIEESINVYDRFFLKEFGYSSPFWNEFRRIMNTVKSNKSIDYCWNNIIKIGRIGAGNNPKINDIIKNDFEVLIEEIKITKPNILIFFTGPRYNSHIQRFIGNFSVSNIDDFKTNELSLIHFDDIELDLCIRTYHPNYLYRSGKKDKVIKKIIELIEYKIN